MSSKARGYLRDAALELDTGLNTAQGVLDELPAELRRAFLKMAKCTSAAECVQQASVAALQQVMETIANTESKFAVRSLEAADHLYNGYEHVSDAFFERPAFASDFARHFCSKQRALKNQAIEEVASECALQVPVARLYKWATSKSG